MEGPGRPTELDDELFLKIRDLILEGKTLPELAVAIDIPFKTVESWASRNYQGFAERVSSYRQERKLQKAEENIDEFLAMKTVNEIVSKKGDKVEYNDPKLVKVKADVSLFVAETLGKKHYSKKTELGGGLNLKNYVISRGEDQLVSASPEATGDSQGPSSV